MVAPNTAGQTVLVFLITKELYAPIGLKSLVINTLTLTASRT